MVKEVVETKGKEIYNEETAGAFKMFKVV